MRGSIRQRSKGSWQLRYEGPPDSLGRRKQDSETMRGTRKEAERVLRERLTQAENGGFVVKSKETVAEFLARWLDIYAATNTEVRTQMGYKAHIRRYIVPEIGRVKLQALKPQHIQAIYVSMLSRGLSARTVHHVHTLLKQTLSHAMKWGLLIRNPADATDPPRPENNELEMWDVSTLQTFLTSADKSRYANIYHLAVLTGLRRSELLGLRWDAIDVDNRRLMVIRKLQRITGMGLLEGQPKTARSKRSIALSPVAVTLLHEVRAQQLERRLALGPVWQEMGYVFTQNDGTPIDPDRVSRDFARVIREAGLPHLTVKGLRHAHASVLLSSGIHPKIVSERLGHSNIAITMDIYSHVLPGLQENAALAFDRTLAMADQGG